MNKKLSNLVINTFYETIIQMVAGLLFFNNPVRLHARIYLRPGW